MSKAVFSFNNHPTLVTQEQLDAMTPDQRVALIAERTAQGRKGFWSIVLYVPAIMTGKRDEDPIFQEVKVSYGIDAPTDIRYSDWFEQGYGFNILIFGFGFSFTLQKVV